MHLVNSIAVIRLDIHKYSIYVPNDQIESRPYICLSSSFVLAAYTSSYSARDFEGLINMPLLERSRYSYPNKSNVLDEITAALSPLIYIRVDARSLPIYRGKCAFYQLPNMCFQCT